MPIIEEITKRDVEFKPREAVVSIQHYGSKAHGFLNRVKERRQAKEEPYKKRRIEEKRDMGSHHYSLDPCSLAALSPDQPGHGADGKRKGIFIQVSFRNRSTAHIFWEDDIRPSFPSGDHGKNASLEYDFSHPLCLGPGRWDYLHGPANDRTVPEKPGHRIFILKCLSWKTNRITEVKFNSFSPDISFAIA